MLAKIGSENGKYMVEFQADARVGLDYYKGKEFMSRVVVQPQIFTLLVINQRQEEQDLNRTLMLKTLIVL